MLRMRSPLRPLTGPDREEALALCALDLPRHVFVAARILEAADDLGRLGNVLGHRVDERLTSLVWTGANLVPVGGGAEVMDAVAERLRRWRHRVASILGPVEQVGPLWQGLEPWWGTPRTIRREQPLLATRVPPSALGIPLDSRVRLALPHEVDRVLPAATDMFTHEIGYAPYAGNDRAYRAALLRLIEQGHTYLVMDRDQVVFKADIGSLALGCAQIQGVWLAPHLRGQGLSVLLMAAVIEQIMATQADLVTLYVNDFNTPARRLYARLGMEQVGSFRTVLL